MEEDKENKTESEIVLQQTNKTINRQILCLASTKMAFYNLHQSIAKPEEKPLTITVGGFEIY
jgi:hypothetical protein